MPETFRRLVSTLAHRQVWLVAWCHMSNCQFGGEIFQIVSIIPGQLCEPATALLALNTFGLAQINCLFLPRVCKKVKSHNNPLSLSVKSHSDKFKAGQASPEV